MSTSVSREVILNSPDVGSEGSEGEDISVVPSGSVQEMLGSGMPNAVQENVAGIDLWTLVSTGGVTMLAGSAE